MERPTRKIIGLYCFAPISTGHHYSIIAINNRLGNGRHFQHNTNISTVYEYVDYYCREAFQSLCNYHLSVFEFLEKVGMFVRFNVLPPFAKQALKYCLHIFRLKCLHIPLRVPSLSKSSGVAETAAISSSPVSELNVVSRNTHTHHCCNVTTVSFVHRDKFLLAISNSYLHNKSIRFFFQNAAILTFSKLYFFSIVIPCNTRSYFRV